MKMKKSLFLLIVLLLIASTAIGCGKKDQKADSNASAPANSSAPNSSAPAGEIKIGAIGPLSGPSIGWGYAVLHGAELAADEVNQQGGLDVNGKKYTIKILGYDDLYTGQGGVTAVNRLVFEDKAKYIIGPISSASLLAIQPITEQAKVILMSDTYTSKALSKDKPYTFRVTPTTNEFSGPMIKWLAEQNSKAKKVAILSPNDETGNQVQTHNIRGYEKAGITVAFHEFYDRETKDFVPILTKILAQGVDMIDADGSAPATTGLIVKQARQLGFKGIMVKTGGPGTADVIKVAGDAANHFYYYTPISPEDPQLKAFMEKYGSKYKNPMNALTPYFYDGTRMLLQAIKDAGTVDDTSAVKAKIEGIKDFPGLLGKLNWSGQDSYGINHQIITPNFVGQVKDGKESVVAKVQ